MRPETDRSNESPTVSLGDQRGREVTDVRRVVLHPQGPALAVDLEVGVEPHLLVDAGLVGDDEVAVVEQRHDEPALAPLPRRQHLLRAAQQLAHRRQVVAAEPAEQPVGPGELLGHVPERLPDERRRARPPVLDGRRRQVVGAEHGVRLVDDEPVLADDVVHPRVGDRAELGQPGDRPR